MEPTWTENGPSSADAGPSSSRSRPMVTTKRRRIKASKPFVSADHRPAEGGHDGVFRVVVITSGSVASVKLPLIVGALCKNENIDVQVVATKASRHFYTQEQVDAEVSGSSSSADVVDVADGPSSGEGGVRVWIDEDEWSDWRNLGDPILHIELRRWADLVVVAPCSADFLAKLAAGFSDNLPLSLLRALPQSTPIIVCPAMNTHMYSHPFTREHLVKIESQLRYLISGPQGAGRLACGDEGPGKMTDWRDIVDMIETFATVFRRRHVSAKTNEGQPPIPTALNPPLTAVSSVTVADEQEGADDKWHGYTGDLRANITKSQSGAGPSHGPTGSSISRTWDEIWPVHPDPR